MVKRYHRSVFFPVGIENSLFEFTKNLNYMEWSYTDHALDRLSEETRQKKIKEFLKSVWLDPEWIFEIYLNKTEIRKVCFRCSFSDEEDLILVVTDEKSLVTLYFNDVGDLHNTMDLRADDYTKE